MSITIKGFTSARNHESHLLKHVIRFISASKEEAHEDPEHWERLIPAPPLVPDVVERRQRVGALLQSHRGCAAGKTGVTPDDPCQDCRDLGAQFHVGQDLRPLLNAYLQISREALTWALTGHDGKAVLAWKEGEQAFVEGFDNRHVFVAALLNTTRWEAWLKTAHRRTEVSLRAQLMEFARRRAAYRRAGTLVTLPPTEVRPHVVA